MAHVILPILVYLKVHSVHQMVYESATTSEFRSLFRAWSWPLWTFLLFSKISWSLSTSWHTTPLGLTSGLIPPTGFFAFVIFIKKYLFFFVSVLVSPLLFCSVSGLLFFWICFGWYFCTFPFVWYCACFCFYCLGHCSWLIFIFWCFYWNFTLCGYYFSGFLFGYMMSYSLMVYKLID